MIKINGQEYKATKFPNGETVYPIPSGREDITFTLHFESNEDLFNLYMLVKHFRNDPDQEYGFCNLELAYVPYSRMDRYNKDYIFSLKFFADFINDMLFDKVIMYEPHSDVSTALINSCIVVDATEIIVHDLIDYKEDAYFMFPDAGAEKRYTAPTPNILVGSKERDFKTGDIIKFNVHGAEDLTGKTVYIMDDLCSRGGTFMGAASVLKEKGAKEIILVVTHLENTVLDGHLIASDLIDKIYATDSMYTGPNYNKLTLFPLQVIKCYY